MKSALLRPVGIAVLAALLLAGLVFVLRQNKLLEKRADGLASSHQTADSAAGARAAALPATGLPATATRANVVGVTNFAALTPAQARQFRTVVAPGVSNFIALLRRNGASRFNPQPVGPDNFLSLHNPKPGNIWDLKLKGNNNRDYFLRFNQTQETGLIAGLTNVVSFFPMSGPSVQGMMEAITASPAIDRPAVEVLARTGATPESVARNLARDIFRDLGGKPDAFSQISTSTERASGIQGGYITFFRPRGLDQPDNALYDTTFGFVAEKGRQVMDTFTHNSARLLQPHQQHTPLPRPQVPQF